MTFSEYWQKNEPFVSNPEDVAELAWNAALSAGRNHRQTTRMEIWMALESSRRFIASYADQLQGSDQILAKIDAAFESAYAEHRPPSVQSLNATSTPSPTTASAAIATQEMPKGASRTPPPDVPPSEVVKSPAD